MKKTIFTFLYIAYIASFSAAGSFADDAKAPQTLRSERKTGQTDRVAVLMEVGGDFKELVEGKQQRVPMSGVARLVYHEKALATGEKPRSVRFYEKAESAAKFKDGGHNPTLDDRRRLVAVAIDPEGVNMFAVREPLTRDELEVIDILGNSLLLDNLLPDDPVAVGESWRPAKKVVAALLGLDAATRSEMRCSLKEVTKTVARVELSGYVEGTVNDTKTRIELKGKYRFDLKTKRIDWFAMVTREDRGISHVASGFDVTVRLQMTVAPEESAPELAEEKLAGLNIEPTFEQSRLHYESSRDHWTIVYDRSWYLNSDDPGGALLRLIREGALTAQCNIVSLQPGTPDKLVSLEAYQEDVRHALGKNFGEFVEAKQMTDSLNRRILRVVVNGAAGAKSAEVPIRWIYYHVADENGRQVALTFTIEQEKLERFADADRPILDSLQFAESDNRGPLAKADATGQTNK